MKKPLLFFLFFAIASYCNAQRTKKNKINYTYSYVRLGNDSVKCKRSTREEQMKMTTYGASFIPNIESNLDKFQQCLNNLVPTDCDYFNKEAIQYIDWAKTHDVDTKDYEDELKYYVAFQEMKIKEKQLRVEKENKIKDSINAYNIRQKRITDSIAKIKHPTEIKKQTAQEGIRVESDYISHCICASQYQYSTEKTDKTIYSPASLCFNNFIVAFYTLKSGEISFEVSQPTSAADKTKDGGWVYTYISEESSTHPFGFFTLQIYHSKDDKKKTALLTYSLLGGETYIISADKYSASVDLAKYFK